MASLGNMFVNIGANTNQLRTGLASAQMQIGRFTTKTSGMLSGLARGFGAIGIAAGASAAAFAVGAGIKKSIQEFRNYEDALLDLQKVMDDSEGSATKYKDQIDAIGDAFGRSSAEVLQGVANFKQSGFTIAESFKLQETAMKATRISELGVAEASEMLKRALRGFRAPASEVTAMLDGLNAISNKFGTNLRELIVGFTGFSPLAKAAGLSMAEAAGMITPIIEVFGSGSEAMTAMRMAMSRLTGDNKKVIDGLRQLGELTRGVAITQEDSNGKFREGAEIMKDVMENFGKLDRSMKIPIATMLFGARQANRMMTAVDQLGRVTDATRTHLEGLGSVDKELNERMKASGIVADRRREAFNRLARDIGAHLAPAFNMMNNALIKVFEGIRKSEELRTFGKAVIWLTQQVKNLWKAFEVATSILWFPFEQLNLAIDASMGKVKEAIGWVESMYRKVRQLPDVVQTSATTGMKGLAGVEPQRAGFDPRGVVGGNKAKQKTGLADNFRNDLDMMKKKVDKVRQSMENTAKSMETSVMTPLETLKATQAEVKKLADAGLFTNPETEKRLMDKAQTDYEKALENMNKATTEWQKKQDEIWKKAGDTMGDLMFSAWEGDMNSFKDIWQGFLKDLQRQMFRDIGQQLTGGIRGLLGMGGGQTGTTGGGGAGGGSLLGGIFGMGKKLLGLHSGGVVTMHNGGLKSDERLAKLQTGEGVLSRRDMNRIGGVSGFNNLRNGENGMTVNVPVNVEGGNNRLAGELQRNIEQVVVRTIKEFV